MRVLRCCRVFKEILCSTRKRVDCRLAEDLVKCLEKGCPTICIYSLLKLLLELIIQKTYYKLMGLREDELLKVVARRSRMYASFKVTMIKGLKGVDGITKRRILNLYLDISGYVHPSIIIHETATPPLDEDLILGTMDYIIYLTMLGGEEIKIAYDKIKELQYCGFEKTLKRLERKRLSNKPR